MPPTFDYRGDLTCAMAVKDLKKTLKWYEETLGFKTGFAILEHGWAEVDTHIPGVSIGFSEVEKPEVKGGATLTFGVLDIDAARADLERKNVKFDGATYEIPGMVKLATFFDPDGHKLMLAQTLAANAPA